MKSHLKITEYGFNIFALEMQLFMPKGKKLDKQQVISIFISLFVPMLELPHYK